MRRVGIITAVVLTIGAVSATHADRWLCTPQCLDQKVYPTEFVACDEGVFTGWYGRIWWGPLTCVGPIEIGIEAFPLREMKELPLIVEVRRDAFAARCESYSGAYLYQTFGGVPSCDIDSTVVVSPRIDLPAIVGLGNDYYLQLQSFWAIDARSAFVRCVRLREFPTAITARTWGRIKQLYR